MGRFSTILSVCLSIPPPWAIQSGLRPSQPGLKPSQPGLKPSQPGLKPEAWLAIRASDLGGMDVRTYRWKIYSFYRTSSPVRAAAQKVNSSKFKKIRNLCNYWLSRHTCIHVKTILTSSAMTKVDVNRKPWVSSKNCKGQPSR